MGELIIENGKQTTINERTFIGIEIGTREGKVMATGSKRGSSADATLRWKKVTYRQWVLLDMYVTKQASVSSKYAKHTMTFLHNVQ